MLQKFGSFLLEILQIIVFSVSIFLIIYLLIMQPHKIKGSSMEPNFHDNEYLLTDKISYRFGEPTRGDVIVFKSPPDFRNELIKRVIGIPGDNVRVAEGKVYLNGTLLPESYIPSNFNTYSGRFLTENSLVTVPPNTYFVLGDNRENSQDSRYFGFVPKEKINGRAWVIYWPAKYAGIIKNPKK